MKRYVITSPAYTGHIAVLYGSTQNLMFIDFMRADVNTEQIDYFKTHVPPQLPTAHELEFLKTCFGTSRLNIAEEGYFVSFDQFWARYDIKRNRARCEKLWNKLNEADRAAAFMKLQMYERHLALNTWRTKAEPDTYLRNRYWENDWNKN